MATNNILGFGTTASNELSLAAYTADAQRLTGNQPGVARSQLVNKALHQVSAIAAGVAQYIANKQTTNVDDTLTPSQLATMLGAAFGGQLIGVQVFNASGTYTPTAGTKSVLVEVQAGGGGGGAASPTGAGQCSAGSGGGGGGYGRSYLTSGFSGVAVTVGAGGGNSAAGGASSFGALISASGGTAGAIGTPQTNATVNPVGSSAGGACSGGNLVNVQGGGGGYAIYATAAVSGPGGASAMGPGATFSSGTAAGIPCFGRGGGGSGGVLGPSSASSAIGGAGGGGVVIVYEFGG